MITQKTLLVLGAGASQPYGFPVGTKLLDDLCNLSASSSGPLLNLMEQGGFSANDVKGFGGALRDSGLPSIDIFLSRQARFAEIAKLALAGHLGGLERRDSVTGVAIEDNWYRHLWGRMQDGADNLQALLSGNRLRIVTFNYDRSLEYFLHRAMQNTFDGVTPDAAHEALGKIQIEHVYGALAPFHHNAGPPYRGYEGPSTVEALRLAAQGIRIVPETKDTDPNFLKVRKSFEWAEKVCFIGFSFHEWNTKRLDFVAVIDYLSEQKKGFAQVFASTYKMTPTEVDAARLRTIGGRSWHSVDAKSLDFLRDIDALN